MDPATAESALDLITSAGAAVWVAGLLFVRSRSRHAGAERIGLVDDGGPPESSGSAEVAGAAPDLAARATNTLAQGAAPQGMGTVKILESDAGRVTFEIALPLRAGRGASLRGELRFRGAGGGRTEVAWSVWGGGRGLLRAAWIMVAAGLVALIVGHVVIRTLVLPHPDPAIRGQTLQMMQCVHFLWPPFLLGWLHTARRRMVTNWLEALVHNLPHQRPAG